MDHNYSLFFAAGVVAKKKKKTPINRNVRVNQMTQEEFWKR